jgi:hypothetical protein
MPFPPTGTLIETVVVAAGAVKTIGPNSSGIHRTSTGQLWIAFSTSGSSALCFWYSDDDGLTWAENVSARVTDAGLSIASLSAFFIDIDDNAHCTWNNGTNTTRYSWMENITSVSAWGTPITVSTVDPRSEADMIAHRQGTGWKVHMVRGRANGPGGYSRLNITAGGVITIDVASLAVGNTDSFHMSIDFRHNGDGKTVQSGPDIWVSYIEFNTGDDEVFVEKAPYTDGTSWTFSSPYAAGHRANQTNTPPKLRYTGTTLVETVGTNSQWETATWDPDTMVRTDPPLGDNGGGFGLISSSPANDNTGNVWLWSAGTELGRMGYQTWDGVTLSAFVPITRSTLWSGSPDFGMKRGNSFKTMEGYAVRSGSVVYFGLKVGFPPDAPTLVAPLTGSEESGGMTHDWSFNDPADSAQAGYAVVRKKIS